MRIITERFDFLALPISELVILQQISTKKCVLLWGVHAQKFDHDLKKIEELYPLMEKDDALGNLWVARGYSQAN